MKRAAIYSRVDTSDRSAMPANKAAAEALCQRLEMTSTHYSDSASGNRPPRHFAREGQLIRPGLTRLLFAVEAGAVDAIIPSTEDALATNDDLAKLLLKFLDEHGFSAQSLPEAGGTYFARRS